MVFHVVRCSSHVEYQLPNDLTRVSKLIRINKSSDPKLLASVAKVETDEELKSDFESMSAFILPYEPLDNSKAY